MKSSKKRLFFAFDIDAPWPSSLPNGRIIEEKERHLTLIFLGDTDYEKFQIIFNNFPTPDFKLGFSAQFDGCFFSKHVAAWTIDEIDKKHPISLYYGTCINWLRVNGIQPPVNHDFTPHVTIARSPFCEKDWRDAFKPLPVVVKDLHLFESLGNSKYSSLWRYKILSPFENLDHTADIAYLVRGENLDVLYKNAQAALVHFFPLSLPFWNKNPKAGSLDDIIIGLNETISVIDRKINSPFKAVSFHSKIDKINGLLEWEMIVDV